jgi:hypothetical protein
MVCCSVPALIFFLNTLGACCGKTEFVVVVPDFLLILFCWAETGYYGRVVRTSGHGPEETLLVEWAGNI